MPEILYKDISKTIDRLNQKGFPQVFLLYGEESLYKTVLETLIASVLPENQRRLNYDALDGTEDMTVYDAIERLNTFSLVSEPKVVALCDARLFHSKDNEEALVQKIKDAYDVKDMKKASKLLASLLSIVKLSFDNATDITKRSDIKVDWDKFGDMKWFDEIISYAKDSNIPIKQIRDSAGDLKIAIEKGFPDHHYLIITTDIVDPKKDLYKTILEKGIVVNCSVPKGDRKADKDIQLAVLTDRIQSILSSYHKKISSQAFQAMVDLIGFDLRNFVHSIEKLIHYIGNRPEITIKDVEAVLTRTKQDPLYELTNAVTDKNVADSLLYIGSLLSSGYYPLQLLTAIANQIRRLLIIKDFIQSPFGNVWQPKMSYDQFQAAIMPALAEFEKSILSILENWEQAVRTEEPIQKKKGQKKKSEIDTDILLIKNSKNPYPIYLSFMKAERFSKKELLGAMSAISQADMLMKSSGKTPRLVLEEVVFRICNIMDLP